MPKPFGILFALIATMSMTTAGFAQAPNDIPLLATRTRINFLPGTSAYTLTTYLKQGVSQGYVLRVAAGQSIFITKTGDADTELLDPRDELVIAPSTAAGPVGFQNAEPGDYTVVLAGQGYVTLTLYVPPLGASPQTPVPLPSFRQRIRFAPGATGYSFSSDLAQGLPVAYLLAISARQFLDISTEGNVAVAVFNLQGQWLPPMYSVAGELIFPIPQTGDYTLVLLGSGTVSISIDIPPLTGFHPPSPQGAQRIVFAPGTDTLTIWPDLRGDGQSFVLWIARGQTLYISTHHDAKFTLYDPEGNLIADWGIWDGFSFEIPEDGNYTVAFYGLAPEGITFHIPPP